MLSKLTNIKQTFNRYKYIVEEKYNNILFDEKGNENPQGIQTIYLISYVFGMVVLFLFLLFLVTGAFTPIMDRIFYGIMDSFVYGIIHLFETLASKIV